MRVRLVHLRQRRRGGHLRREELLDVEKLSIGRGTNNDLPLTGLSIPLSHSRLRKLADGVQIKASESAKIDVNGRAESECFVQPGDVIRVGPYELRIVAATGDEDVAIEILELAREGSKLDDLLKRTSIGANRGFLTQRKLAWGLGLSVAALFLALPLSSKVLESAWDSGALSRSHAFIADDCQRCHATAFRRVRDEACLDCHAGIGAHTPADSSPTQLAETRCASCHMEHNGPMALAALEQALCADCHGDLSEQVKSTSVGRATDFGKDHPQFRLSVVQEVLAAGLEADVQRVVERLVWDPNMKEQSGLKFNHYNHVGRVMKGGKGFLKCSSCHVPDVAGKNMLPVDFEEHCQECHSLSFDERFKRQALHVDPVEMRQDLLEFYAEIELRQAELGTTPPRLMAGRTVSEERRVAALTAAESAVTKADEFLMNQEKPGECARCHFLGEKRAEDGGQQLSAVNVAEVWMPKGEFLHHTHRPFPCQDCHPAAAVYNEKEYTDQTRPVWSLAGAGTYALLDPNQLFKDHGLTPSEMASDVLIPNLEKCQSCHGGAEARAPQVPSDCVLCHPFHREEHGRMRAVRTGEPSIHWGGS